MKKTFFVNKLFVYFTAALLLLPLFGYSAEPLTKQQQWEQMAQQVDSWTDGLGKTIDPEIKETVIALNVLGFTTYHSCEGHLNWGNAYPWITFENAPEIEKLQNEERLIYQSINNESARLEKNNPGLSWDKMLDQTEAQKLKTLWEEKHSLNETMNRMQLSHFAPLQLLLEMFYQSHPTSHDHSLVLSVHNVTSLNSLGGDWQPGRSEEEKQAKLLEYRAVMKAFTAFLKDQFFKNDLELSSS